MNKKVLILEDDQFLVRVMQKKFEKSGHEVKILLDGTEAVSTAEAFQPDVILADLIMPETNGFQAIAALKDNPKTKDIPVVVTSNLSTEDDIKEAKKLGVAHYFIKSNVDLNSVIEFISDL